jgi:hypothetical protein
MLNNKFQLRLVSLGDCKKELIELHYYLQNLNLPLGIGMIYMKVLAKVLTFERFIGQDNKQGLSEKFGGLVAIFCFGGPIFSRKCWRAGGSKFFSRANSYYNMGQILFSDQ